MARKRRTENDHRFRRPRNARAGRLRGRSLRTAASRSSPQYHRFGISQSLLSTDLICERAFARTIWYVQIVELINHQDKIMRIDHPTRESLFAINRAAAGSNRLPPRLLQPTT